MAPSLILLRLYAMSQCVIPGQFYIGPVGGVQASNFDSPPIF